MLRCAVSTCVLKIPYPEQLLDFETPRAQWEQVKRHFDCPAFSFPFLKRGLDDCKCAQVVVEQKHPLGRADTD